MPDEIGGGIQKDTHKLVDIIRRDLDNVDNYGSMRPGERCGISSYLSSFMPTTTDDRDHQIGEQINL